MLVNKNPKLRFSNFKSAWTTNKLNVYTNIFDGVHQTPKYQDEGIRFVSVENINDLLNTNKFISEKDYNKNYKNKKIEKYDILMTRIGEIGKPAFIDFEEPMAYYVTLSLIKVISSELNSKFLYYYIQTDFFQRELYKRTLHVAFPKKINLGEIGLCNISYPCIKEQEKIVKFFSALDLKIETQRESLASLQELKKGYMQKIFSQKVRFKDVDGQEFPDWKERKVEDFLEEYVEKTTENNQYPTISSTNSGLYLQSEYFNHQVASKNNIGYKILKLNQIVLSPQNLWLGNLNFNDKYDIGMVSPSYKIFDVKQGHNPVFIKTLLTQPIAFYLYGTISNQGASVVRRNLDLNSFYKLKFSIPCLEEQNKIADFLSTFDKKIELEREILQTLKELKKGFLQQMFV